MKYTEQRDGLVKKAQGIIAGRKDAWARSVRRGPHRSGRLPSQISAT